MYVRIGMFSDLDVGRPEFRRPTSEFLLFQASFTLFLSYIIPLSVKIITLSKILFSLLFKYASPFWICRYIRRLPNVTEKIRNKIPRNKMFFLGIDFSIRPSNCWRSKFCKFFESRKISSGSTKKCLSLFFFLNIFLIIQDSRIEFQSLF